MGNKFFKVLVLGLLLYNGGVFWNCNSYNSESAQDASFYLPDLITGNPPDHKGDTPDFLESLCRDGVLLSPLALERPLISLVESARCLDQLGGWLRNFSCFQDVGILPIATTSIPPIKMIEFTVIVGKQTNEKGELWVRELGRSSCLAPPCTPEQEPMCKKIFGLYGFFTKGYNVRGD